MNQPAAAAQHEEQDFDSRISAVVRVLMAANGIAKATDLGDRIGIKRSTMGNRLNGTAGWQAAEVARMALYFGVQPAIFYEGVENLIPTNRPAVGETASEQPGLPTSRYVSVVPDELSIRRDRHLTRRAECGLPLAQ